MRRSDYELVAAALNQARPCAGPNPERLQWAVTVDTLAAAFAESNERFDHQLFLDNCGVDEP